MKKKWVLLFAMLVSFIGLSQTQVTNNFNPNIDKDSNPSDFIEFDGKLFFVAENDSYGSEIWYKDGIDGEATLLKDINPGPSNGIPNFFSEFDNSRDFLDHTTILNGELYFIANDGSSNGDLWKTNGTPQGTTKITNSINLNIDYINNNIVDLKLTTVNNYIFFNIKNDNILQVWKSDGTNLGTTLVKGGIEVSTNSSFYNGKLNDLFVFEVQTFQSSQVELWRSDGTEAGTFMLINDIDGNGAGAGGTSAFTQHIVYNNELYFVARYYNGSETIIGMMKTDGTIENTVPVNEFFGANALVTFADVVEVNNKLYLSFYRHGTNHLFGNTILF